MLSKSPLAYYITYQSGFEQSGTTTARASYGMQPRHYSSGNFSGILHKQVLLTKIGLTVLHCNLDIAQLMKSCHSGNLLYHSKVQHGCSTCKLARPWTGQACPKLAFIKLLWLSLELWNYSCNSNGGADSWRSSTKLAHPPKNENWILHKFCHLSDFLWYFFGYFYYPILLMRKDSCNSNKGRQWKPSLWLIFRMSCCGEVIWNFDTFCLVPI